ncbi:hypothetical protein GGR56DRAFT_664908 [Xylariaceae sp. FL0804]|nr:hypothetical protein GGR56DRAFT_664908 [Xylariaceae sp. FL0804]
MSRWSIMRNFYLSDEELGKKDDDHNAPKKGRTPSSSWHPSRGPPRRSLKRVGLVLLGAVVVYLFVKNIPVLGPHERMRRPIYAYTDSSPGLPRPPPPQQQRPQYAQSIPPSSSLPERTFNGPVKFFALAPTLHAIAATRGREIVNRNVLFAASSLKSAATMLPIACQMGMELKNYVHFVLLSRSDIGLEELRSLNGIDDGCQIIFHDGRPDFASISTEERLENAAFRALHHTNIYMHPQAIMVDGSDDEEDFLIQAMNQHVRVTRTTLIPLPRESVRALSWMTRLDSQALRMWDKLHINILIQATRGTSGSLIRLLKSLSSADYTSSSAPHITIDLPPDIEPSTRYFLDSFSWPPPHVQNPTNARQLSLRHRIPHGKLTEEESSARFLESFWPAPPQQSHVLVLSPQVELSPYFYHYLKYSLLEYRYSATSSSLHWDRRLFGISLEQPLGLLDGKSPFFPPSLPESSGPGDGIERETPTPFLWQAPTSSAVLFLGEKWMELHDFVARSMDASRNRESGSTPHPEKMVSKQFPSWLEYAYRLCRARGYWLLYPGQETAQNLATVHHELAQLPEEYAEEGKSIAGLPDDASDEDIDRARQKIRASSEIQLSPVSLLESLSNDGNLRSFYDLPLVTWDGQPTSFDQFNIQSAAYAAEFKEKVGGCNLASEEGQKERINLLAQDLFCDRE